MPCSGGKGTGSDARRDPTAPRPPCVAPRSSAGDHETDRHDPGEASRQARAAQICTTRASVEGRRVGGMRVTDDFSEAVALRTLMQMPERKRSIPALVADVLDRGSARALLEEQEPAALFDPPRPRQGDAEAEVEAWFSDDRYQVVSILDDEYPKLLKDVRDAPPFLFYRGSLDVLHSPGASVVGTRDVSDTGIAQTQDTAHQLVERGIPVISGMARGVDATAHWATLNHGGIPIGVIATSILGPYTPAPNRDLHEAVADRGLLVSQFAPGTPVHKGSFLQRNATMSGLGFATIIIEAREKSGTRAQARNAMHHGRPVILTESVISNTQWGKDLITNYREAVHPIHDRVSLVKALKYSARQTMPNIAKIESIVSA